MTASRLPVSLLQIRAMSNILPEIAYVTADLLPGLERERHEGDEAEGEPFPVCDTFMLACGYFSFRLLGGGRWWKENRMGGRTSV